MDQKVIDEKLQRVKLELYERIKDLDIDEKLSYIKRLEILETMIDFATNHHHSAHGNKLTFDDHTFPHVVELYMESALHKEISIMAGTQIGKTDWLVIYMLACAYNGLHVFYVLPKDDFKDTYVTDKIIMRIKLSPFYQKIFKEGAAKSKDMIQFGTGTVKFVGANSAANFAGFTADVVIIDETDEIATPEHIKLAYGRLRQSKFKFVRYVGNPRGINGFINTSYNATDMRVRMFPCTKCGELHELDWFQSVVKILKDEEGNAVGHVLRDHDWTNLSTRDIKIKCPKKDKAGRSCCDGDLLRFDKRSEWVATGKSKFGEVGYKMPTFVSPNTSIRDMYKEFSEGINSPSNMEAFYITGLAEPYSSSGDSVSETVLDKCAFDPDHKFILKEDQAFSSFKCDNPCVMGVDTADDHWDITISHQERMGNPHLHRLVFVGKMSPRGGLDFLHDLVERYNVVCCVIDSEPQSIPAREFQQKAQCTVWRWVNQSRGHRSPDDLQYKHKEGTIVANRTDILDKSYKILRTGQIIIPVNYYDILEGIYFKEMTALSRITEENATRGVFESKWVGPNSDHLRFSDSFRNMAVITMSDTMLTGAGNIYSSKPKKPDGDSILGSRFGIKTNTHKKRPENVG